jgi:hypothetical protein
MSGRYGCLLAFMSGSYGCLLAFMSGSYGCLLAFQYVIGHTTSSLTKNKLHALCNNYLLC